MYIYINKQCIPLKALIHGKASIAILVSCLKKYSVNSAITLYHATFRSIMQLLEVA
jgi:hypothetical protein